MENIELNVVRRMDPEKYAALVAAGRGKWPFARMDVGYAVMYRSGTDEARRAEAASRRHVGRMQRETGEAMRFLYDRTTLPGYVNIVRIA